MTKQSQRRTAHSKVRTGCDTCKRRRIKCDETQPVCLRCIRTGVACEGYHAPPMILFEPKLVVNTQEHRSYPSQYQSGRESELWPNKASFRVVDPADNELDASGRVRQHHTTPLSEGQKAAETSDANLPLVRPPYEAGKSDSRQMTQEIKDKVGHRALRERQHKTSDGQFVERCQLHACPTPGLSRARLSILGSSQVEVLGLEYFEAKTIQSIGVFGPAAKHFFAQIVPEMSFYEPAIRHQVIALGLLHICISTDRKIDRYVSFAVMQNYGAALQCLASSSQVNSSLILSSCVLFIVIEMLREGPIPAFVHLKKGLAMLREKAVDNGDQNTQDAYMNAHIEPVLSRLALPSTRPARQKITTSPESDLQTKHESSDRPVAGSMVHESSEGHSETGSSLKQRDGSTNNREIWRAWHENFVIMWSFLSSPSERRPLQTELLKVHSRMSEIAVACQDDEMMWDSYIREHRAQLDVCSTICHEADEYSVSKTDVLSDKTLLPGVFAPLFQIAIMCRDPHMRRAAVGLLHRHHRHLGHEDECFGVLAAELIIDLEEKSLSLVSHCHDIPVQNRVKLIEACIGRSNELSCAIRRWPFTGEVEQVSVHVDLAPNKKLLALCSCKSFRML